MHRSFLMLLASLLLLLTNPAIAANSTEYFKVIPPLDASTPEWARLMYSDDPNVNVVEQLYSEYYQQHAFKKTVHTQNFKYWLSKVSPLLDEAGYIRPELILKREKVQIRMRQAAATQNADTPQANWSSIGPFITTNGTELVSRHFNANDVDVSINNTQYMITGAEGGHYFVTSDQGLNWQGRGYQMDCRHFSSVAMDNLNPDILYVSCGAGLFKSTDFGLTHTKIHDTVPDEIKVHPNDSDIIFLSTSSGVYRSQDQGQNWEKVLDTPSNDIEFHPTDTNILYALGKDSVPRNVVYRSDDAGSTWQVKDQNGYYMPSDVATSSVGGAKLGVTPADPDRVYVALIGSSKAGDNGWIGVYVSEDKGESWVNHTGQDGGPYGPQNGSAPWNITAYSNDGYQQGYYNFDLAVSSTNPDKIWVGTIRLLESTDAGKSFIGIGAANSQRLLVHADIQQIVVVGSEVFLATDGGIDYSSDELMSRETRHRGITGTDFWGFNTGWNEDVIVGGRYHNGNAGYFQAYGKGNFLSLSGVEAPTGYVDPFESRVTRFSDQNDVRLPLAVDGAIENVRNFALLPSESYVDFKSSNLLYDVQYRDRVTLGRGDSLYRSTDNGKSFTKLLTIPSSQAFEVIQSRANPELMYFRARTSSGSRLYRSRNRGDTWREVNSTTFPRNSQMVLAVSDLDANVLYASVIDNDQNKVIYKSTNAGTNWENITSTSIAGMYPISMSVYPSADGDTIYLASNDAIWVYSPTTEQWFNYANGLPKHFNVLKLQPFFRDAKMRLATSGDGAWETNLHETPQTVVQAMTAHKHYACSTDTVIFDSYSVVDQTDVSWKWSFSKTPTSISSYTERRVEAVFEGLYGDIDVTLEITKNGQVHSRTFPAMITIGTDCESDLDGDGIVNFHDDDIDGDGLSNRVEDILGTDTDRDGLANSRDTDADNDGIPDQKEAPALQEVSLQNTHNLAAGNNYIAATLPSATGVYLVEAKAFVDCYSTRNSNLMYIDVTQQKIYSLGYQHFSSSSTTDPVVGDGTNQISSMSGSFGQVTWRIDSQDLYFGVISNACGGTGNRPTSLRISQIGQDSDASPNYLDTDSDGDGCFDAIEGSADFSIDHLNQQGRLSGAINSLGVPSSAGTGQDIGDSQNSDTQSAACSTTADSDGDGVTDNQEADNGTDPNNACDYQAESMRVLVTANTDCDADGVQDFQEVMDNTARDNSCEFNAQHITQIVSADQSHCTDSDQDGVFDINDLDNDNDGIVDSLEVPALQEQALLNATDLAPGGSYRVQTFPSATGIYRVEASAFTNCYSTTNTHVMDINVTEQTMHSVSYKHFGANTNNSAVIGEGTHQLSSEAHSYAKVAWRIDGADLYFDVISNDCNALVHRPISLKMAQIGIDNDALTNQIDNDSDGDGCSDALEGSGQFTIDNLNVHGQLAGGVSNTGIPLLADDGQGIGNSQNSTVQSAACSGSIDSDGDGVTDRQEALDGTTSDNACDYTYDNIQVGATSTQDCDKDGVTERQEFLDGTIRNDSCSFKADNISEAVTADQSHCQDRDNDGVFDNNDLDNDNDGIVDTLENQPAQSQTLLNSHNLAPGNEYVVATLPSSQGVYKIEAKTFVNCYNQTNHHIMHVDVTHQTIRSEYHQHFNRQVEAVVGEGSNRITSTSSSFGKIAWRIEGTDLYYEVVSNACGSSGNHPVSVIIEHTEVDTDGTANYLDTDSDGDGCFDAIEGNADLNINHVDASGALKGAVSHAGIPVLAANGQTLGDSQNPDTQSAACSIQEDTDDDNDGIPDVDEGNGLIDSDGDGIPDSQDTDSDNDGIPDSTEAFDADGDGQPDHIASGKDSDGDGLDDAFDPDNGGTAAAMPDRDSDGIPDYLDQINNSLQLQVKVLLQGPYNANDGLMKDDLRALELIPTTQPYNDGDKTQYEGQETAAAEILTMEGNDAPVDWVLVELKQADTMKRIAAKAVLLQRDGDVMDAQTGETTLAFTGLSPDNYHVSIKHRNHLGIISAQALPFANDTPTKIDFSQATTAVAGEHARLIDNNLAVLWAGDANNNNSVVTHGPNNDLSELLYIILSAPDNNDLNSNFKLSGYSIGDLNMDGITLFGGPNNDANLVVGNVFMHEGNNNAAANYIIEGKTPEADQ